MLCVNGHSGWQELDIQIQKELFLGLTLLQHLSFCFVAAFPISGFSFLFWSTNELKRERKCQTLFFLYNSSWPSNTLEFILSPDVKSQKTIAHRPFFSVCENFHKWCDKVHHNGKRSILHYLLREELFGKAAKREHTGTTGGSRILVRGASRVLTLGGALEHKICSK